MRKTPDSSRSPSHRRRPPGPHGITSGDAGLKRNAVDGAIAAFPPDRRRRGPLPRIGIVGGGISGLGAALALRDHADVTVLEKVERPGGHAYTVDIEYDGAPISVDVGFIVYNTLNYPNFTAMLDELGVATIESDMSFSVSDPDGFEWSSNPTGLFAWKRNALNPAFLRLLSEIIRFNRVGCAAMTADGECDTPLGAWLDEHGFSEAFRESYLLPMGGAIWSTPEGEMLNYPAGALLSFFQNHRLMHAKRPKWRTIDGGSRNYVSALCDRLGDRLRTGADVQQVRRLPDGSVELDIAGSASVQFDQVIMANHAPDAHAQLDPAFEDQRLALGSIRCSANTAYLHRDASLMPRRKSAWASWNVLKGDDDRVCVTYWMNRLQGIDHDRPLFLTLNPVRPPRDELVFETFAFDHPMYDLTSAAARRSLQRVQGRDGLYFAGAWLGDGFHEAGLRSGLEAAYALGGVAPWEAQLKVQHPAPQYRAAAGGVAAARL